MARGWSSPVSPRHINRSATWCFASTSFTVPTTTNTANPPVISGLPVAVPNQTYAQVPANLGRGAGSAVFLTIPIKATSTAGFYNGSGNATTWNALSGQTLTFTLVYPAS